MNAADQARDYYDQKDQDRRSLSVELEAARGPVCGDCQGEWEKRIVCMTCNRKGRIRTVSDDEFKRLERAYESACDVGD